jgi:endonuclease YncB( thermonuclease family)
MNCLPYSCFFNKKINNKEELAIVPIQWNDTVQFIPPIKEGQVIKVYDGDTITIAAKMPYKYSPLYRFSVRLCGIDSPEMNGNTQQEREAAHKSQKALEALLLHKVVRLTNVDNEKYGRILAEVFVKDDAGKEIHVQSWLLQQKYAIPYDGKKKIELYPVISG